MTRTVAVVQARMGSTRLPGKSTLEFAGIPVIDLVLRRVSQADTLDRVVVATSELDHDYVLADRGRELGVDVYRGSETDVLGRVIQAASKHDADTVVRVCADNPLVAPGEIDRIVRHHHETDADYSFNHVPRMDNGYPDGLGAEVSDFDVLSGLAEETTNPDHREHVTAYIWDNPANFDIETVQAPAEIEGPDVKLDIDTETDQERLERLFAAGPDNPVLWTAKDIVRTYRQLSLDTDESGTV